MLDIKRIKDPAGVKAALRAKEVDCDEAVDKILALDEERRRLIADTEARKARQNKVSKEIPALKKQGKDVAPILKEMAELKAGLAEDAAKLDQVLSEYRTWMLSCPICRTRTWSPAGRRTTSPCAILGSPTNSTSPPSTMWTCAWIWASSTMSGAPSWPVPASGCTPAWGPGWNGRC